MSEHTLQLKAGTRDAIAAQIGLLAKFITEKKLTKFKNHNFQKLDYGTRIKAIKSKFKTDALGAWQDLDMLLCDTFYHTNSHESLQYDRDHQTHDIPDGLMDRQIDIASDVGGLEMARTEALGFDTATRTGPRLALLRGRTSIFIEADSVTEGFITFPIRSWVGSVYNDNLRVCLSQPLADAAAKVLGHSLFAADVVELPFVDGRVQLGAMFYSDWEVSF